MTNDTAVRRDGGPYLAINLNPLGPRGDLLQRLRCLCESGLQGILSVSGRHTGRNFAERHLRVGTLRLEHSRLYKVEPRLGESVHEAVYTYPVLGFEWTSDLDGRSGFVEATKDALHDVVYAVEGLEPDVPAPSKDFMNAVGQAEAAVLEALAPFGITFDTAWETR